MKILLIGIGKDNLNYRKIEGFYNAFSKIGDVEWVQSIFDRNYNNYDIIFGEMDIDTIFNNIEHYTNITVKTHIFWSTIEIDKLRRLSELKPETNYICAYKSNIFDRDSLLEFKNKFGNHYQHTGFGEGILIDNFLKINSNMIAKNLKLIYLPCCLSEKKDFNYKKDYDICYFGTLNNRPLVDSALKILSNKYNTINTAWDRNLKLSPNECYELYRRSKTTLSEQINPVLLEYPVRLGECSSAGCRLFLIEKIKLNKSNNMFVPQYTSCSNVSELIYEIESYLDSFSINDSIKLYDSFNSTYDSAIKFLVSL